MTCEYQVQPNGIDIERPRFTWKLVTNERGATQKLYELRVGTDAKTLTKGQNTAWQSGLVSSDQSILISYDGPALNSRIRYYWQVKSDTQRERYEWVERDRILGDGLLKPGNWTENYTWFGAYHFEYPMN